MTEARGLQQSTSYIGLQRRPKLLNVCIDQFDFIQCQRTPTRLQLLDPRVVGHASTDERVRSVLQI